MYMYIYIPTTTNNQKVGGAPKRKHAGSSYYEGFQGWGGRNRLGTQMK